MHGLHSLLQKKEEVIRKIRRKKGFSSTPIHDSFARVLGKKIRSTQIFMMVGNVPFSDHALRIDLIHIRLDTLGNHADAGVRLHEVRLSADLTCRLVREQTCPSPVSATTSGRTL